jgi:U3 small nucleolar RNA-associated protein 14
VTLDLGSDEEFEIRDEEGDEGDDDERERLKASLIGENEDDEKIDSDDDEELDSDAAFEEDAELSDQESSSSDADSASEEENLDFDPSDDEEIPEALDILDNFVSNLDVTSRKRKATEDLKNGVGPNADTRARKRRSVMERTEAGAENEFRARSSGICCLLLRHYLSPSFLHPF